MCDASGTPAPSYAELESQLAAAEAEADVARLERLHAACDATIRALTSEALAAVRGQEAAEARAERLAGAAEEEALAVLTRLADSAVYWSSYDVPVGIVADVDAAKARLAGVLR